MIWCVEDDASIRDIELYALRAAGLEAEGFPDGDSFWQALRISDNTAFFLLGELVEYGDTETMFSTPREKRTEDYITGRFG